MPKRIKIPLPPDPLGLFHPITGGKEELEIPAPPFPFPLPGEEIEEEEEEERLGWREESEEGKILNLLKAADRELKRGNIEGAYTHLDYAIKLSRCSRCVRNMRSIELKIRERHLSEARRRLDMLITLIPSYYRIIETEGEIGTELNTTKTIEEECSTCNAAQIIEECQWDTKCLDYVIQFIDEKKKSNEKIYAADLVRKAKEYVKMG